jgi:hypothetical protein
VEGSCQKQEELRSHVRSILAHIDDLNREQMEALKSMDDPRLMELDKELELLFGKKERAFGSLFQHPTNTAAEPYELRYSLR